MPLLIQPEWTKHHGTLFKNGSLFGEQFNRGEGFGFGAVERTAYHGVIPSQDGEPTKQLCARFSRKPVYMGRAFINSTVG